MAADRKTVVITGASGGFGRLSVELFARAGYRVVAALRGGRGHPACAEWPASVEVVDFHLDRPDTFAEVARQVGGELDVLINNAGYGLLGPTELHDNHAIRVLIDANVSGTIGVTRALLPALRARRGRILTVGSVLGQVTLPYYGLYAASKAALRAWNEALRYELRPFGVQATIVQPGGFRTSFLQRAVDVSARTAPEAYRSRFEALTHNLARMSEQGGDPRRVAARLLSLAERRRVPAQSLIGADAYALRALQIMVPGPIFRAVAGWIFERFLLRAATSARAPLALPEGGSQ